MSYRYFILCLIAGKSCMHFFYLLFLAAVFLVMFSSVLFSSVLDTDTFAHSVPTHELFPVFYVENFPGIHVCFFCFPRNCFIGGKLLRTQTTRIFPLQCSCNDVLQSDREQYRERERANQKERDSTSILLDNSLEAFNSICLVCCSDNWYWYFCVVCSS